jgi:hypothetical protein
METLVSVMPKTRSWDMTLCYDEGLHPGDRRLARPAARDPDAIHNGYSQDGSHAPMLEARCAVGKRACTPQVRSR